MKNRRVVAVGRFANLKDSCGRKRWFLARFAWVGHADAPRYARKVARSFANPSTAMIPLIIPRSMMRTFLSRRTTPDGRCIISSRSLPHERRAPLSPVMVARPEFCNINYSQFSSHLICRAAAHRGGIELASNLAAAPQFKFGSTLRLNT